MREIAVQEAAGLTLCHDITEIIPGVKKAVAFRRGHTVRPEDIPRLLDLGKEHLYVWSGMQEGLVHEDDAAFRLAKAIAGNGVKSSNPSEGRINIYAECAGVLKINLPALQAMNSVHDITIATWYNNREVKENAPVAGTRVIPLMVREEHLMRAEAIATSSTPIVEVRPFLSMKIGVVTTGSEVFHGRIEDAFGPVLRRKFSAWGSEVAGQVIVPDDIAGTKSAISDFLQQGVDVVVVSGGMSVDPDDRTPAAIKACADYVVNYGAPVFPGGMFMVAYAKDTPILGLPGCVMYNKASVFDLVMPRILTGERLHSEAISALGHGGLCLNCPECHFPHCSFGCGSL